MDKQYRVAGKRYGLDYRLTKTKMHTNGRNIPTAYTTLDDLVFVANYKMKQYHDTKHYGTKQTADKMKGLCYKVADMVGIKLNEYVAS